MRFQELDAQFNFHRSRAVGVASNVLRNRDDAEDVVQQSYLSAYSAMSTFKDECDFWPWFRAIVMNHCREAIRQKAKANTCRIDFVQHENLQVNDHISLITVSDVLATIVQHDGEAAVHFKEHYVDGYTIEEVCRHTFRSKAQVCKKLKEARKIGSNAFRELVDH